MVRKAKEEQNAEQVQDVRQVTDEDREQAKQARHAKGVELAERRVSKLAFIGTRIEQLSKYPWEDGEKEQILKAAKAVLAGIEAAFAGKQKRVTDFKFSTPDKQE